MNGTIAIRSVLKQIVVSNNKAMRNQDRQMSRTSRGLGWMLALFLPFCGLGIAGTVIEEQITAPYSVDTYGDQGVNENNPYTSPAASITGTPVGSLTYSLSGADAARFSINASNGVVTMVARDYETPLDADGNNLYSVVVTATDSDSNTADQELDVVVFNDCSDNDSPERFKLSAPDALADTMGNNATLRITLLGGGGVPLNNVAVMFVKTSGAANISSASGTTNGSGIYESTVTAGASTGVSEFTAMYDSTGNGTPDTTVTLGSPTVIQVTSDVGNFAVRGMVGIGTEDPDPSSVLEVAGTEKGVLIPRVALTSTTDTTTIDSPAVSLLVYNTSTSGGLEVGFVFWDGTEWKNVCAL